MFITRLRWRAALGLAVMCGLSTVQAGNLLKKLHGDCHETAVKIPAQRVVVHTAASKVTVQETAISRGVGLPTIGTVYMPLAMPAGVGGVPRGEPEPPPDHNPLRAIHAAELARLQYQRACAVAKADLEAARRAFDRASVCGDAAPPVAPPVAAPADTAARVAELTARIDRLLDRVSAVEKLKLIHDNYLREQIEKEKQPAPMEQKPTPPMQQKPPPPMPPDDTPVLK